jgi:hypothetical protein
MTKQTQIDFARADQLGILRDAIIPPGPRIRAMTTKNVLNAIDHFCRGNGSCFASQDTLAEVANCSRASVQRAISHLLSLGVLIGGRKSNGAYGGACNEYRIVWSELRLMTAERSIDRVIEPTNASPGGLGHPTNASSGNLNASLGATNASLGATNASPGGTNRLEAQEPPPTVEADSVVVAKILNSAGLSPAKATELAARHPITIDEADRAVRTYQRNRKLLTTPGALVWFFESGQWPSDGVVQAPTRQEIEDLSRKRELERQARQRSEAARIEEVERTNDIEQRFGEKFDQLSPREQRQLAESVLSTFEFQQYCRGTVSIFRLDLLQAFEQHREGICHDEQSRNS